MAAGEIEKHHVQSLDVVRELLPWRQKLATTFGTGHANADLQLIDMLIVMLAGFFNPLVRTQRMVDALSGQKWMKELTEVERIPRSTLSDALTRFDSEQLRPLIHDLVNRVPALARRDADLAGITRQIVAADGSYFTTGCNVAWAMLGNSRPGKKHDQVRWNLQLEVDRFIPIDCDISGKNDISEPAAFIRNLHSQVIYVADRNFFSYAFINAVFEKDSSLVLRLRKDPKFDPSQAQPLCETDIQTGVISDDLGHFHGAADKSSQHYKSFTDKPPVQLLRRVVVWDEKNQKQIILVTDLLDVPAHVIADIYRRRWQIELFFKWIKTYASFDHLISHHPNGVRFQFYVAVIATLLLHLASGRKVSKYTLFWLGSVATGQATFEQMQQGLSRVEREKELERARKKRLAEAKKFSR